MNVKHAGLIVTRAARYPPDVGAPHERAPFADRSDAMIAKGNNFRPKEIAVSALILAVLGGLIHFAVEVERNRREQATREQVGRTALARVAALEAEINANVYLANGMVAHIVAQDGMIDAGAETALRTLMEYGRHIRNIGVAPDNRITMVYPLQGNEAAIGLHYPDIPTQWTAVKAAIDSRSTVMAGPVPLRQGGRGVISRTPVFMPNGAYWGIVSLVLNIDGVLKTANIAPIVDGLAYALRGVDGKGPNGAVFLGDPALFAMAPDLYDVKVPGGAWQMAVRPLAGWRGDNRDMFLLEATALTLVAALSLAVLVYARDRRRASEGDRRAAALIDASNDAACLLTADGEVVVANDAMVDRLGTTRERLIGANLFGLLPAEIREEHKATLRAVATTGQPIHFSDQVGDRYLENSLYPIKETDGTVHLIGLYSRDVSGHINLQQLYFTKMLQLDAILSCSSVGVTLVRDRVQIWTNQVMADMFGVTIDSMNGRNTRDFYPDDTDYDALGGEAYPILLRGEVYMVERRMRHFDGHLFWVRMWGKMLSPDDPSQGSIWTFLDITKQREAEAELALAASVFHETTQAIMVTDAKGVILSVNNAFVRITGYDRSEAVGATPRILRSNRHDVAFFENFWRALAEEGRFEGEIWNRRKDGEAFLVWQTVSAVRDSSGQPQRFVALFSDITELRRDAERIRHYAFHDALTDLPNRVLLGDRLAHALAAGRRTRTQVALLFLDLDGFKAVNDTHGHDIGDDLLREVAARLIHVTRASDTVSRLGGDEFVVVLENAGDRAEVAEVAGRVVASLSAPMDIRGVTTRVGVSIGIAMYPDDGEDADTLLANADAAMYVAKRAGRDCFHFHTPELTNPTADRQH